MLVPTQYVAKPIYLAKSQPYFNASLLLLLFWDWVGLSLEFTTQQGLRTRVFNERVPGPSALQDVAPAAHWNPERSRAPWGVSAQGKAAGARSRTVC